MTQGVQTDECVFDFISQPRTPPGHVTPSGNVPPLQMDTAVHVAPLWFTNMSGPTEKRFPSQNGHVTLLQKNCG
jgi:hypothetical protein